MCIRITGDRCKVMVWDIHRYGNACRYMCVRVCVCVCTHARDASLCPPSQHREVLGQKPPNPDFQFPFSINRSQDPGRSSCSRTGSGKSQVNLCHPAALESKQVLRVGDLSHGQRQHPGGVSTGHRRDNVCIQVSDVTHRL